MTVCIAALCRGEDNTQRVVLATDRMVTQPGFMEYEHTGSKMVELTSHAAVMVAGSTLDGMRLVNEAAAAEMPETVAEIAQEMGRRFGVARNARAGQLLGAHGLTWETFHQMHGVLNPQVVMALEGEIGQFGLGVELLLAGEESTTLERTSIRTPTPAAVISDTTRWAGRRSVSAPPT